MDEIETVNFSGK